MSPLSPWIASRVSKVRLEVFVTSMFIALPFTNSRIHWYRSVVTNNSKNCGKIKLWPWLSGWEKRKQPCFKYKYETFLGYFDVVWQCSQVVTLVTSFLATRGVNLVSKNSAPLSQCFCILNCKQLEMLSKLIKWLNNRAWEANVNIRT